MGFFHLVEEDDLIGAAAYLFGQLASLVVPDIAGRRAKESADRVGFSVFAHIDAQQGFVVVKQKGGERLGQFGLADAGGAQEEEGSDRPPWVFEPAAGPPDRVADGLDRLFLADDTVAQLLFHLEQLDGFGLQQIADGDAGPGADDGGDVAFVDNIVQVGFYPPADDKLVVCFFDPHPFRLVPGGIFVVPLFPGFFFSGLELAELCLHLAQAGWHQKHGHAQLGGRFVHQVDRFVGQPAVRDIAVAEFHCLDQRFIAVVDLVVFLVA